MSRHSNSLPLNRLALLGLAAAAGACSLALQFDECEVDEHCDTGRTCSAGACVEDQDAPVPVTENIAGNVTWGGDASTYVLDGVIFVEPGATLTIQSGTTILGGENSALVVQAGAKLFSRGDADAPVVFTSAKPQGERATGDWGGLALLGNAPTNFEDATGDAPALEGVLDAERGKFGGNDEEWSCGVLEYTRIEFAGLAIEQDNELNGLTLAGCGSATLVDYVQVHYGLDDGVEVFGGNVNLTHVVITRAQDDSLDWDMGWRGAAQFIAIQQDGEGDNGFEASSDGETDDANAEPRANPTIWNVTMIGDGAGGGTRAMTLKDGTRADINNVLMIGHGKEGIDVQGASTVAQLEADALSIKTSVMFQIGAGGANYFPSLEDEPVGDDESDDDDGFDEATELTARAADWGLQLGVNPNLASPFNLTDPGWAPSGTAVLDAGAQPLGKPFDRFDDQADYAGAFAPAVVPWTSGWTAYPEN